MPKNTAHHARRTAAAVAATAALGLTLTAVTPAAAAAPPAAAPPAAAPPAAAPELPDPAAYADCPTRLPAGADPAQWRCEITVARGSITLGGVKPAEIKPITLVHAEGPLPGGDWDQVFGGLRADATPVPGGLLGLPGTGGPGPLPGLSVQPEYGGYADFLGTGTDKGGLALKFRLVSPLLNRRCSIGTDRDPVVLHLSRAGDSRWLSQDPPLVAFDAYDHTLTAPAATGCGPLGAALNHRFALPAPSGVSRIDYTAHYTFRSYDQLRAS
ncbi:hypothetical protein ACIQGZ_08210 [Streptomyces sp. NPDC092296]|uniref:hypothetical protein n=1 Tax=Streptomyces sp. NPDC092296 TaxID=3366012 RepID=UPI0037FAC3C2